MLNSKKVFQTISGRERKEMLDEVVGTYKVSTKLSEAKRSKNASRSAYQSYAKEAFSKALKAVTA